MQIPASSVVNPSYLDNLPPALRVLVVTGLGLTVAFIATRLTLLARPRQSTHTDKRESLIAYLREHLSGSDVAIQVVEHLSRTHAGSQDGRLFAHLFEEFEEDRGVVRALLSDLGVSSRSLKRLAGHASGSILKLTAGGEPGDLSLFRTLEALAIGVQGKRCLWRALQSLGPGWREPGGKSFADLEARAERQWAAIEERRRALTIATFPGFGVSPAAEPRDEAAG